MHHQKSQAINGNTKQRCGHVVPVFAGYYAKNTPIHDVHHI